MPEALQTIFVFLITLLGMVFLLTAVFLFLRASMRRRLSMPDEFHMITLLVKVPKELREHDKQKQERKEVKDRIAPMENFYANLGGLKPQKGWHAWLYGRHDHIALEIVADHEGLVTFFVTAPRYMVQFVSQQMQAQFHDAHIEEVEDYNIFSPTSTEQISEINLAKPNMFSVKTYTQGDSDPLNALTNAMSQFQKDEGGAIQILVRPAHKSWRTRGTKVAREMQQGRKLKDALRRASTFGFFIRNVRRYTLPASNEKEREHDKNPYQPLYQYRLSPMEEEIVKSIEKKASKAGMETQIRVVASAANIERAEGLLNNILHSFAQFSSYEYENAFRAGKGKNNRALLEKFVHREYSKNKINVLSTEELASVFHLPLADTETPNIRWLAARKAPAPFNLPKDGIILGSSVYRGQEKVVRMKRADRRRHFYIIGKSGSGKSVLMENMAVQDIRNGEGVCVVDPHGELIESILSKIPTERADDVVIFSPADTDRPIGLNMLEFDTEEEQDFVVQEMIQIFYKLFPPEMIGPMFEHNMRNVMLTLMADKEHPGTIADIPRMFTDPAFQKYKVQFLKDPVVLAFWEKEMAQTTDFHKSEMLGYLISKVGRFVENNMMRNIIGQPKSGFDIKEIMDNQKILLVNLSKGQVGEVNSALLGLIIVSKLQMAAQSRASKSAEERKDFYLYIDEFQNFVTDSIATILSEARKYKLNLILAHQYIGQLVQNNKDSKIRDAVFGNVGTIVSFRIGVEDAEMIAKEFAPVFGEYDVINIEKYTAYIKLLIDNTASKAFNMLTYAPEDGNLRISQSLKQLSRLKYGVERQAIEAEILDRTKLGSAMSSSSVAASEATR